MKGVLFVALVCAVGLTTVDAKYGFSSLYNMVFGRPGCNNGCGPFSCCTPARGCSFVEPVDFDISEFSPFMFVVFTVATAEVYRIDNVCYSFIVDEDGDSAFSRSIVFEDGTRNIKTFEATGVADNVFNAQGGPCRFDFEVTAVIQELECLISPIYILNRCFCSECCNEDSMVIAVTNNVLLDELCIGKAIAIAEEQFPCFIFRSMPNLLLPSCIPPLNILVDLPLPLL
ncbi:uncharacterized protein LOC128998591 [Macrosteles quadrilineatus]|uniref:uncharacterized protein LOC128998591 n=1 Tax=Macrosteles quadrilineatus TaxID=74068 RepID=UPI0023E16D09|nr:uncharacterized protein LOC128998591 [Macrosteles quadrilineatus]XP_054280773.1 uncharacterized protein LOC128998591 [Macrosteles quadrilineatus]XP_054280774.1 uncharacterized protein LOC128998591 [Macrosteles quadrilineatus]